MSNFKSLLSFNKNPHGCISLTDTFNHVIEEKNIKRNNGLLDELNLLVKNSNYQDYMEKSITEYFKKIDAEVVQKKRLLMQMRLVYSRL